LLSPAPEEVYDRGLVAITITILAFVGSILVVVGIVAAYEKWSKRRQTARTGEARSLGYELVTIEELPEDAHFPLFTRRRSRTVAEVIRRPGDVDFGFEYSYRSGSSSDDTREWFACALVRLRFDAPPLTIVERGFTSVFGAGKEGERIRFGDIAPPGSITPTQDLDDEFRFYGDPSFAAELLSPAFQSVLTSEDWKRTSIGFNGRWMLCCSKERSVEARVRLLTWAQALRDAAPPILARTHPPQPNDP
jgi:hypothetical protein